MWYASVKVGKGDKLNMSVIKKTVVIHPLMDSFIRKTWALLIENGKDASYSTALNFMLLATIMEAGKEGGLSEGTRKITWSFIEDQKTIGELNLKDSLIKLEEKIKPEENKTYIS